MVVYRPRRPDCPLEPSGAFHRRKAPPASHTRPVGLARRRLGDRRYPGSARHTRDDPRPPVSLRDGRAPSYSDSEVAERIHEFTRDDITVGASEAIGICWGDGLTLLSTDVARE